jgi:SAM-dependent methyltransferase
MNESVRYDGHLQWCDETFPAFRHAEAEAFLRDCLDAGRGEICLDVACGTGRFGPVLAGAGYRAVGFDLSADQLTRYGPEAAGTPNIWTVADAKSDIRTLPWAAS